MAQPGESKESSHSSGNNTNQNSSSNQGTTTAIPTSASTTNNSSDPEDADFDPSAQALVDEIDDEGTLEEEEALAGDNAAAVQSELDCLKRESEMPIEELLAYYQRMRDEVDANEEEEPDDGDCEEEDEEELNKDVETKRHPSERTSSGNSHHDSHDISARPFQIGQSNQQQPIDEILSHEHRLDTPISPPTVTPCSQSQSETRPDPRSNQPSSSMTTNRKQDTEIQESSERPGISHSQKESVNHQADMTSAPRPKHSMTEFLIGNDVNSEGVLKTLLDYDLDDSDELDEDYSYTDDENDDSLDWRRTIHVGPDHQADVPEGLSYYEGDLLPYDAEDKLLWRCNPNMSQEEILDYLKQAALIPKRNDISISPASVPKISDDTSRIYRERIQSQLPDSTPVLNDENIVLDDPPENLRDVYMSQSRKRARIDFELEQENAMDGLNQVCDDAQLVQQTATLGEDNSTMTSSQGARNEVSTEDYFQDEEQLLYLLIQCSYNCDEALRRRRLDPFKCYIHEPMSLWSQDECLGFEHGLRVYGKDFKLIRDNKVPTRTRAEVVAFYYLWKKSERHDVYTNQYKLDKKRCLSHPGTTDYMDKFIEDNESLLNASATPTPTLADINQLPDVSNTYNSLASHESAPQSSFIASGECVGLPSNIATARNQYKINQPLNDEVMNSDKSMHISSDTPI